MDVQEVECAVCTGVVRWRYVSHALLQALWVTAGVCIDTLYILIFSSAHNQYRRPSHLFMALLPLDCSMFSLIPACFVVGSDFSLQETTLSSQEISYSFLTVDPSFLTFPPPFPFTGPPTLTLLHGPLTHQLRPHSPYSHIPRNSHSFPSISIRLRLSRRLRLSSLLCSTSPGISPILTFTTVTSLTHWVRAMWLGIWIGWMRERVLRSCSWKGLNRMK